MKIKTLLTASTLVIFTAGMHSCKKADTANELETTFQLSADQAIADNLTQDANDVFNEVAVSADVMGGRTPAQTMGILGCATVTVTPLLGWPKTIVIDFGATNCSSNGTNRRGKINVVLTDSVRKSGSTATMTFTDYYVNDYKVEGKIVWTNTSANGTVSWQRQFTDGKITSPSGTYWTHNGTKIVVQTAGSSTPYNLLDDIFSITGNHTVTNSSGDTRTATVLTALQKKTICANIDKGTIKLQGPNHYAIIDFGDGTCDNQATLSIDGQAPRTITLR